VESFSPPNLLCKIVLKEGQRHVGNINLHGYHPIHRFISLGIMIGEASARGRGIGKETCSLVIQHAFDHLNIHKVIAGTVVENVGMTKVFTQLGFTIEGTFVQHYYLEGRYHDTYRFGLLRENFVPHHKSVP
jgi:RimJ/RimL family protein N-acetyltransferase